MDVQAQCVTDTCLVPVVVVVVLELTVAIIGGGDDTKGGYRVTFCVTKCMFYIAPSTEANQKEGP